MTSKSKQNKLNIVINGGSNINNFESSFQGDSIGGIINVGFPKACSICQETVGSEYPINANVRKKMTIVNIASLVTLANKIVLVEKKNRKLQKIISQLPNDRTFIPPSLPELTKKWQTFGFTTEQCQDWINTSSPAQQEQIIREPLYYAWLRDIKGYTPESLSNDSQKLKLRTEYQQQLESQIEQFSNDKTTELEEQTWKITENNNLSNKNLTQPKISEVSQILDEIKFGLNNYQTQLSQLQDEDQQLLQQESEQSNNLNALPLLENQLTVRESQQKIEKQVKPNMKHLIGKGGYGEVYYGEWKLQEVAVKKLYLSLNNTSESDIKDIRREIDILKSLRNRYIIQYYGTYSDNQELLIIMDYAENGTLTKFINDNKNKEHDWNFNANLIKQMTLGLAYIHHENIIHRDLKSMNILLDDNFQAKISDFGLSKIKSISSSQSKDVKGTLKWMAPELLRGGKYSEQSDIYALGMVIWEIVAKCTTPFKDIDHQLVVLLHIIKNGKETIPSDAPKNIQDIIRQCWKSNPSERIALSSIIKKIESDKTNSQVVHHSKSLDFSNLIEPQNDKKINEQTGSSKQNNISQSIEFNLDELNQINWEEVMKENNWTNIHPSFIPQLIQTWQNLSFTYQQTQDWINIGLTPQDYEFATWLRDVVKLTPEQVLNESDNTELRELFQEYKKQLEIETQIEQSPK